ncbi:MAG: hypothetical protein RIR79_1439 [Pseudomonadota bacterium]|jgi:diguanylate cyclase (GGDEF)-like protein/PAS domain S-box-containing protein
MKKAGWLVGFWIMVLCSLPTWAAESVRIGVFATRSKPDTVAQWTPLANALREDIPDHEFEIIPVDYADIENALSSKKLDFLLTNPATYIKLISHRGLGAPLATLQENNSKKSNPVFGGVIFTQANETTIHSLKDIKGKTVAFTYKNSFGGYEMQELELFRVGLTLAEDTSLVSVGMPHENVVNAVLTGTAQVGFVRTGVLEKMMIDNRLDIQNIRIVNSKIVAGFPHFLSTALYPEWVFVALKGADEKLARHVTATLFMLDTNTAVTHAIGIHGFTTPADYTSVADLMRELRIPPFDESPAFTLKDVFERYRWYIIGGALALGAILLLTVHLLIARKKLASKQKLIFFQQRKLQLAASVFLHSSEAIFIFSISESRIIDVNDAFLSTTGYHYDEVIGKSTRFLRSEQHDDEFFDAIQKTLTKKHHWHGEIWVKRKNGEYFPTISTISAVHRNNGSIRHIIVLFSDITEQKKHQRQLVYAAHYDVLTNLPNRILLAERLRQGLSRCIQQNTKLAVVYLDLDGFKAINDKYGHATGDQLLITIAVRMKETLRDGDTLARLGGDEFVAVLVDQQDSNETIALLIRLLSAVSEPVSIGERTLQVSASLGVTFYPQHENKNEHEDVDADMLLRQSDYAMYQAKQSGKNRFHIFDPEHDRNLRGLHENVERIRQALHNGEFVLHYQPKVNMRTGLVEGVEALIRWEHPEHGLLPPGTFLPLIEEHPIAVELGEWVISTALFQMKCWADTGLLVKVSVNMGAQQLQQPQFCQRLREILALYPDVQPDYLMLEVLETSALQDLVHVAQVIEECQKIGVLFALDDFGTGYSSLTYLKHLRVSVLKIDRSFVRDMLEDPDDLAILEGIIGLARAFHRQVVAEGVETLAHGTLLLELGCELVQGHGIARPMPPRDLPQWVTAWQSTPKWEVTSL